MVEFTSNDKFTERYARSIANPKNKKLNLRLSVFTRPSYLLRQDVSSFREAALVATEWARKNGISVYHLRSHDIFVGSKPCCRVDVKTGRVTYTVKKNPLDAGGHEWNTVYHPDSDPTWKEEKDRIVREETQQAQSKRDRENIVNDLMLKNKQDVFGQAAQKMLTMAAATGPHPFNIAQCQDSLDRFLNGKVCELRFGYYNPWELRWSFQRANAAAAAPVVSLCLNTSATGARVALNIKIFHDESVAVDEFAEQLPAIMQAVLLVRSVAQECLSTCTILQRSVAEELADMQLSGMLDVGEYTQ